MTLPDRIANQVVKIVGVFVGEHSDNDEVYAVFYGDEGQEYLARKRDEWEFVAAKHSDGTELVLAEPIQAPDPGDVMWGLLRNEPQIEI